MTVRTYVKRVHDFDAVQFTGRNFSEVLDFTEDHGFSLEERVNREILPSNGRWDVSPQTYLYIVDLPSELRTVYPSDWLVYGDGEFRIVDRIQFEEEFVPKDESDFPSREEFEELKDRVWYLAHVSEH